jgi:hypothetical protein
MAVTQVGICNSALIKVGQAPISSIDQDTRAAKTLKAVFELVQDEVMASHPWNFALKRVALTPTATTPAYEYDYEYDLPNDCLRVLELESDIVMIDNNWIVEGRKLLSNDALINMRYIYRNEDYNSWSAVFAEVMAWRIAFSIAYNMTQSTERERACGEGLKTALISARSVDGAEGVLRGLITDQLWQSRR